MIEAKDVLLIVLAFCILWFTAFVCWLIYQIASIMKNVNDVVSDAHKTLGKMEAAITGIRGRFDHAVSGMMLILGTGRKLADMMAEKSGRAGSGSAGKAAKKTTKAKK
ncbi:MAG: hypothetical protein O2877_01925 [bacterium]|nr:hypothetical protein [bacterium]